MTNTNLDALRKERTESNSNYSGGSSFYKFVDGENIIRVLPAYNENGMIFRRIGIHKTANFKGPKTVCPSVTFGEPCRICDRNQQLFQSGNKEMASKFRASRRFYMNILDMRSNDQTVYIADLPPTIFDEVSDVILAAGDDSIIDPQYGINFRVFRSKKNNFPDYKVTPIMKPFDLAANGYDVDLIMNSLNDLDAIYREVDQANFKLVYDTLNQEAQSGPQVNTTRPGSNLRGYMPPHGNTTNRPAPTRPPVAPQPRNAGHPIAPQPRNNTRPMMDPDPSTIQTPKADILLGDDPFGEDGPFTGNDTQYNEAW